MDALDRPNSARTPRTPRLSTFGFFEERSAGKALPVLAALPTAYIWLLPLLAWPEVQFAHRCDGYPWCDNHMVTVADYLAGPQATGSFAAAFFWPVFHMWSLKGLLSDIAGRECGFALVMAFYCCFGASLAVPATTSRAASHLLHGLTQVCALGTFALLFSHFKTTRRLLSFKVLLGLSIVSTALAGLCLASSFWWCVSEETHPLAALWPWTMFVCEAVSLSCVSLLPWFWSVGETAEESVERRFIAEVERPGSLDTLVNVRTSGSCLCFPMLLLAAAPVLYVWLLPCLARLGFARMCEGLPRCAESEIGASVSNFIATPQATGAMAAVFFWPLAHIWSHKAELDGHRNFLLLLLFLLFFGLFLATPVTFYPAAHTAVVATFCLCGLLYFQSLLACCCERVMVPCRVLLRGSIASFAGVLAVNVVSIVGGLMGTPDLVKASFPWAFYVCEASGLSCMALFPWCWHVRSMDYLEMGRQALSFSAHSLGLR